MPPPPVAPWRSWPFLLALAGAVIGAGLLLAGAALARVTAADAELTRLARRSATASGALPAAAIQISQSRTAARRIAEVLDAADPVPEPDHPAPWPAARPPSRCAAPRSATRRASRRNGQDLDGFAADDVRTVIGGCPQDPHIFDASIRQTLSSPGPAPATSSSPTPQHEPGC